MRFITSFAICDDGALMLNSFDYFFPDCLKNDPTNCFPPHRAYLTESVDETLLESSNDSLNVPPNIAMNKSNIQ